MTEKKKTKRRPWKSPKVPRIYPENYVCKKCGATFYGEVGKQNHENFRPDHEVVPTR